MVPEHNGSSMALKSNGNTQTSNHQSASHLPSQAPPPPPNGGSLAWTQCAGIFCLWFAAWGLVNSFGRRYTAGLRWDAVLMIMAQASSKRTTKERSHTSHRRKSHGSVRFNCASSSPAPASSVRYSVSDTSALYSYLAPAWPPSGWWWRVSVLRTGSSYLLRAYVWAWVWLVFSSPALLCCLHTSAHDVLWQWE